MKAIKFIHDIIHRTDYVYISEFFRFIGVFICEDIIGKEDNSVSVVEQNTKYDICIYIGRFQEKYPSILEKNDYEKFEAEFPEETIKLYDEIKNIGNLESLEYPIIGWENNDKKRLLNHILDQIFYRTNIKIQESLVDIYVKNNLVYHSINLQYYPKKTSFAILEAKSSFIKSYEELKEKNNKLDFYTEYALLWCKVKANLACHYADQIVYFFIEILEKQCQELCEKYSEFCNAKVLLGLCYEPFKGNATDALRAFSDSLSEIRDNSYSSSVYYWMGKWFEYYDKKEDAEKIYLLAKKRKIKYRSNFKLALLEKEKENYNNAINIFDEILEELSLKVVSGFADPLELQYVFKTYCQKCLIYYKLEDDNQIIENGEKAVKIIEQIDNNIYLSILYRNETELKMYKELILERLYPKNVYWFLVGAYRNIDEKEKGKKYQEKLDKLEQTI